MNLRESYKVVIKHNLENIGLEINDKEVNRLTDVLANTDEFLIGLEDFIRDYVLEFLDVL